jgi:hypothetical protein
VGVPAPPGGCSGGSGGADRGPLGEDADRGFRCTQSLLLACSPAAAADALAPSARVVAACVRGCAAEGEAIDDDDVTDPEIAARILCRH